MILQLIPGKGSRVRRRRRISHNTCWNKTTLTWQARWKAHRSVMEPSKSKPFRAAYPICEIASKKSTGHCFILDSRLCVILELVILPFWRITDDQVRTPTARRNLSVSGAIGVCSAGLVESYQGKREAQLTVVQGVDWEPFKVKTLDLITVAPSSTKPRFAWLNIDALNAKLMAMAVNYLFHYTHTHTSMNLRQHFLEIKRQFFPRWDRENR